MVTCVFSCKDGQARVDRGTVLLQGLRQQLQGWADPIRRATCATSVTFIPHELGEFTLRVEWMSKEGTTKTFDRKFTRQEVFGSSYGHSPAGWRVERRACDHARDTMRQVLEARGV